MKKVNPLVSIIVPIYNAESYLQECINSIRAQTYSHLEIILIDDGSLDNCGLICDENAKEDNRFVVIHKENAGLSSARNVGLDIAKGEFVSFIDADDTVHPKFIEIMVGLCKQYGCDIAQCDYLSVSNISLKLTLNPQQSLSIYNKRQAMYELCCTNNAVKYAVAWNKIYKKRLFKNIRYPVGKIHEDEFTTYLLLWEANKIVVTNQYLYYYLRHKTSITGKPFSFNRLDALDAYKKRLDFLMRHELEGEYFCTLEIMNNFIQKNYLSIKENIKNSEKICKDLLLEKENIQKLLNDSKSDLPKSCIYPKQSKIVLYGAGHWGRIYYKWIKDNHYGTIVGWVDNAWFDLNDIEYCVSPIDMLLRIEFDYVLITLRDKLLQEEITENLICWGISQSKILRI